jgi:hypothetical protein
MSNNNNRMIVFASILGAILATSILALNPSTITNASAQPYGDQYGYDNNNYQKKSSHVDIQKINCVNSNVNINGVDVTEVPQDSIGAAAANEGDGATADAAITQNGNGLADRINFERNLVNICVNVNDNEQLKVSPPPPATLAVTKTVTCTPDTTSQAAQVCETIRNTIFPSSFTILVFGINANPSEFAGSSVPVNVTLDAGDYDVGEESPLIEPIPGVVITLNTDFSEDCKGTMEAGESKTCDVTNNYSVRSVT